MAIGGQITRGFRPRQHVGHVSMPMASGTSGGAIAVGDVVMASSGTVVKATADPVAALLGVATKGATASGQEVTYIKAEAGVVFEALFDDQANGPGHVLAAGNLYTKYAIQVDPSGATLHYVDENDTSNYTVVIVGFVDPVGTTGPSRVLVQFVRSAFIG